MKLIAHRGNINGRDPKRENRMDHIQRALDFGYDVEIDVWYEDKQWWMGHDEPKYKTGITIFKHPKIWIHAKNSEALKRLNEHIIIYHFFWQQNDDYSITSKNFIWCHVGALLLPSSICCLPEQGYKGDISQCYGICSDLIKSYESYK